MAINHTFTNTNADGTNTAQVRPSNWNAAHTIPTGSITQQMLVPATYINYDQVAKLNWYGLNHTPSSYGTFANQSGTTIACDGQNMWFVYNAIFVKINIITRAVTTYTASGSGQIRDVAFDGTNVWSADIFSSVVYKCTPAGTITSYACGAYSMGCCFDGQNIWVTSNGTAPGNGLGTTITKILASSGVTQGTYTVGTGPTCCCFDGTYVWVASTSAVTRLLASNGSNQGTFTTSISGANGICFDGQNIWVCNRTSSNLVKMSTSGAVLGVYPVGASQMGVCFDGVYIWITCLTASGANLYKLTTSGTIVDSIASGNNPWAIGFDGSNIWVCVNGDSVVKVF